MLCQHGDQSATGRSSGRCERRLRRTTGGRDDLGLYRARPDLREPLVTEIVGGEVYQYDPLGNAIVRARGVRRPVDVHIHPD